MSKETPNKDRLKFQARHTNHVIVLGAFALVAVCVMSWVALGAIKERFSADLAVRLESVLNTTYEAADDWVQDQLNDAWNLAVRPDLQSGIRELAALPRTREALTSSPAQARIRDIVGEYLAVQNDLDFFVVAPGGITLASTSDGPIGTVNEHMGHEGGLEFILAGQPNITLPHHIHEASHAGEEPSKHEPEMFTGVPIVDEAGTVVAAIIIIIDPSLHFTEITQMSRPGETGDTYTFDIKGRLLTAPRFYEQLLDSGIIEKTGSELLSIELRNPGGDVTKGHRPESLSDLPLTRMAAEATAGRDGVDVGGYLDYRGVHVVGAWKWNDIFNFGVAAEMDVAEAYGTYNAIRRVVVMTLSLATLIFALFAGVLIRRNSQAEAINERLTVEIGERQKAMDKLRKVSASREELAAEVAERIRVETALRQSEARLNEAQHIASIGSWEWDITGNRLVWSDEVYRIFGLTPGEFEATYDAFLERVHQDDVSLVTGAVDNALLGEGAYSIEHRIVLQSGEVRHVHERGEVTFSGGRAGRMAGTVQDVTERVETELEFRKLSTAIENSANVILITDSEGHIEYVNQTFETVTGYTKEEAVGQTPRILSSGETPDKEYKVLWDTIKSGETWRGTFKNKKKDGNFYWGNAVITPIKDDRGRVTHFLAVQEDVTAIKASEEKLKYLEDHDGLTGLASRSSFFKSVDEWIRGAKGQGRSAAVVLIDIDKFRLFNDTYGHSLGDDVISAVGRLLDNVVCTDTLECGSKCEGICIRSRLAADEFAVFLPGAGTEDAVAEADRIRAEIEGLRVADLDSRFTASLGVVVCPEHGNDAVSLITSADASMQRAKELGGNKVHVFRPEDKDLERMHSRLKWKERIIKAIDEDRFDPWFQPIMSLADGKITKFEVLARMRDEQGNILLPGAFIGIAEIFNLIGSIDRIMIRKAMELQAALRREGREASFSLNLSGKELGDPGLLLYLKETLEETGANPGDILFEITETAAVEDIDKAVVFIAELKALGCHFSLDDFGVGFTSFSYLKDMDVDFIKIDGSFIRRLHENPKDQLFVRSMVDVAKGLGIKTVAEFVETEETLKLLKEFGVDFAQGYFVGKPSPQVLAPA